MPAAVLFDLDDTLCVPERDPAETFAEAFETADLPQFCSFEQFRSAASDVGHADSDREFRRWAYDIAAERFGGPPGGADAFASAWDAVVDPAAVEFRSGACAALDHARECTRVGLVTNGSRRTQPPKLETLGIADAFEVVVYAGDDTPPKPAAEPFERACRSLGVAHEETLHVGDSLASDVAGANRAGLRSAWCPTAAPSADPDPAPDYTLESVAGVAELLPGRRGRSARPDRSPPQTSVSGREER